MGSSPERRAGVADVDCTGMEVLVTGSTSGIGRVVALALGRLGAKVIVHGRNDQAGRSVVKELDATDADATFVQADFADLDAVRTLAATVRRETNRLDVLVNNAGGLFRNGALADTGVEYTFQVNHLSPYLLTVELRDHLADEARVVTTASDAHKGASLQLQRVRGADTLNGFAAYSHSKLANTLFAAELARRLDATGSEITSNSLHPGAIPGSGFGRFLPGPLSWMLQRLEKLPGVTAVADGAAAILFLAISPRTAGVSGRYFSGQTPATPSEAARDRNDARRLWVESARFLGIDEPLAEGSTRSSGSDADLSGD